MIFSTRRWLEASDAYEEALKYQRSFDGPKAAALVRALRKELEDAADDIIAANDEPPEPK